MYVLVMFRHNEACHAHELKEEKRIHLHARYYYFNLLLQNIHRGMTVIQLCVSECVECVCVRFMCSVCVLGLCVGVYVCVHVWCCIYFNPRELPLCMSNRTLLLLSPPPQVQYCSVLSCCVLLLLG